MAPPHFRTPKSRPLGGSQFALRNRPREQSRQPAGSPLGATRVCKGAATLRGAHTCTSKGTQWLQALQSGNSRFSPRLQPRESWEVATSRRSAPKLNPAGSALVYSTYLGGSGSLPGGDVGDAIAVDTSSNAYVTGLASSLNFPLASPIQSSFVLQSCLSNY